MLPKEVRQRIETILKKTHLTRYELNFIFQQVINEPDLSHAVFDVYKDTYALCKEKFSKYSPISFSRCKLFFSRFEGFEPATLEVLDIRSIQRMLDKGNIVISSDMEKYIEDEVQLFSLIEAQLSIVLKSLAAKRCTKEYASCAVRLHTLCSLVAHSVNTAIELAYINDPNLNDLEASIYPELASAIYDYENG